MKTKVAEKNGQEVPRTGLRAVAPRQAFEVRQDEGSSVVTFSGYALRWEEEAEIRGFFFSFVEKWRRGSCKKTVEERGPGGNGQIKLTRQHDTFTGTPRAIAARLTELREDAVGLRFTAETIDTSTGRDLAEELRTGVIDTVSVGFDAIIEEWDNDDDVRTIVEARLYEISPVNWPAFEGATIDSVRGLSEFSGWLEEMAHGVREGKVLSESNRRRLAEARDRINDVLDGAGGGDTEEADDEPGDEGRSLSEASEAEDDATLETELAIRELEMQTENREV